MRGPGILFQIFLHCLCEFGVAVCVSAWLVENWNRNPSRSVIGLVKYPVRIWLALAFGALPIVISLLAREPMARLAHERGYSAVVTVTFLLSAFYGIPLGLAASWRAAPQAPGERSFLWRAVSVSAAVLVVNLLSPSVSLLALPYSVVARIVITSVVLIVAPIFIRQPPGSPANPEPAPVRSRPLFSMVVGFAPSALILVLITVGSVLRPSQQETQAMLWAFSFLSLFCCIGSAAALFSRKTGGAIIGGILLLLLNAFIAFFFGCCASFNGKF